MGRVAQTEPQAAWPKEGDRPKTQDIVPVAKKNPIFTSVCFQRRSSSLRLQRRAISFAPPTTRLLLSFGDPGEIHCINAKSKKQ